MEAMSITGFLATTTLNISGFCPLKCVTRNPPCEPPTRAIAFLFNQGYFDKAVSVAKTQSDTSLIPTRPGKKSTDA